MTQKQTENCLKVKSALIDIFGNGRLTKYLPTSYLAFELARTYNHIIKNEPVDNFCVLMINSTHCFRSFGTADIM